MKRPLLTALGLFLLGELAGQWIDRNLWYSGGAALGAAGIVTGIIKNEKETERNNRLSAVKKKRNSLLFLLFFVLGFAGMYAVRQHLVETEEPLRISEAGGNTITIEGVILEVKDTTWIVDSDVGRVLVYPEESGGFPGDLVRVTGRPERIPEATNPGAFDTAEYYESEGVRWRIRGGKTELLEKRASWFRSFLDRVRKSCREHTAMLLPEREAGVLTAMLLGERSGVDRELKELYRQNGIAHILAISGLHVSLIGAALMYLFLFFRLSRRRASILTILLLLMYGALTGFSPATLRAILMLISVNLGGILQRTADLPTSMGTAMFLILTFQPYRITSTGMLMSFLAVMGVLSAGEIYTAIFARDRFLFLPLRLRAPFKKLLHAGLFALLLQCFMQPLMLREYYAVSPYAPFLNLLVIPLLTVAVASGALGLLFSYLPGINIAAAGITMPCRLILQFYEWLCRCMLRVPGHEVVTGHISTGEMLLFLGIAAALVWFLFHFLKHRKRTGRKWRYYILVLSVSGILLLSEAVAVSLQNRLTGRIIFLDVGQGDGCIVHTKEGTNLLFDCGSSSKEEIGTGVLIPALRYFGIDHVDAAFLSHTDLDHVSGVEQLLESRELYGIHVLRIIFGEGTKEDEQLRRIMDLAEEGMEKTEIIYLSRGDVAEFGAAKVMTLLPKAGEKGEGNDYSMVNLLTVGDCSVLFTGDIGQEREKEILDYLVKQKAFGASSEGESAYPDILKVAHHGSRYSTGETFLELWTENMRGTRGMKSAEDPAVQQSGKAPPVAVISCGRNNRYGHPAMETLERLDEAGFIIYRTDRNGAVIVELP